MIYELATLASFLFLILTFILNTYQLSFLNEIKNNNEKYSNYNKKLNALKVFTSILILSLFISKLIVLLFGPDTLIKEESFSNAEILIFVVNFFYAVLWIMILLFLYQSKEIKQDFLINYLQKISYFITLVFILDFVIEGIVYLTTINDYLSFSVSALKKLPSEPVSDTYVVVTIIIILTIMLTILFILFLIKRNIKLLRYLELTTLVILFTTGYLVFFKTSSIIGWNESLVYLLKLFSYRYGFTGFIFLITLAVTMITNSSVVLLFNIKEFFNNEQQLKNKIINLVKVGYVATSILSCMAVWPHIYLWF